MKEYREIYGRTFEIIKKGTKKSEQLVNQSLVDYGTIEQAYRRPSVYKTRAWHDWRSFVTNANADTDGLYIDNLHICAKNDSFFAVSFDVYEYEPVDTITDVDVTYIAYITAYHNYLVEY